MDGILTKIARENSIRLPLGEACYFGFFILLSVTKGLGLYEGQILFELLIIPAFLLAIVKILITPYTKGQWVMQILSLILTAVVFYHSRERGILFLAFTVLGMKNIPLKKAFHVGLWVWSVCSIVLCVFSFFRLEHTIYRVHEKMGMGHIFRWSLGFTHPNILHITYLALCAFIIYELGERYGFRHFILLMAGNIIVFLYSISYTGVGIVTLLLAAALYVHFRPKFCILEKLPVNLVLPICLILSFAMPLLLFDNKYAGRVQRLNQTLNTRLELAEQFLRPEYRSLFGADISQVVRSTMTMDNSYVWGYINYGLIPFTIIILGYFALMIYDTHRQKTRELMILVGFLAAGWTEQLLFNTSYKNVTLLFLGNLLFVQREGAKEYCLFPYMQRVITVPFVGLPDRLWAIARDVWQGCRIKIAGSLVLGAVLGIIMCAVVHTAPQGYVVPRFYTDGRFDTSVYLQGRDDPAYEGWAIMNYTDTDTPMQLIQGQAVMLENVRYYVGSMLIGGLCGAVIGTVYFGLRQNDAGVRHKERVKTVSDDK